MWRGLHLALLTGLEALFTIVPPEAEVVYEGVKAGGFSSSEATPRAFRLEVE